MSHRRSPNKPAANAAASSSAQKEIVLLAILGMSPAVLTETIWALAQETPTALPHRIIVLSTQTGLRRFRSEILNTPLAPGLRSPWEELRKALSRLGHSIEDRLSLDTSNDLHVFTRIEPSTGRSRPLDDLRTQADQTAAADQILDAIRSVVENDDQHLIASLAGGRKTMGALLYGAMTLIGRQTDRLTHVLVNKPYDSPLKPGFFFPAQPTGGLRPTEGGKPVSPAKAHIELADVPFVPLREVFPRELGRRAGNFRSLVAQYRNLSESDRQPPKLTFEASEHSLLIDNHRIALQPKVWLLMLFLAERAHKGLPDYSNFKDAAEGFTAYVTSLLQTPRFDAAWMAQLRGNHDFIEDDLRRHLSVLRGVLKTVPSATPLLVRLPKRGRFSLRLEKNLIALPSSIAP